MSNKTKILYAEDDQGLARLVQRRLERHGLDVTTVHSAEEAMSIMHERQFDIVITDYRMPGKDGIELIKMAKQHFPDLPLVMMSAMGDLAVAVEAMKHGAADYVLKDVEGSYLDLLPLALQRIAEKQRLMYEKARVEEALAAQRELSHLALDSVSQGICIFDENLRLQLCNERFLRCCEYPDGIGRPGTTLDEMIRFNAARGDYGDNPSEELICAKVERTRTSRNFTYEFKNRSGRIFEVSSNAMPNKGFVVTYTDVTQRKEAEHKIWLQAHYDALTGLANRFLFHELLKRQILQMQRSGKSFCLLFIDLDGFKAVNDTYGHDKGDLLLQAVSTRLREAVRESDIVARLAGDEFTVILPELQIEDDARHVADKILAALCRPCSLGGIEVQITASIGLVVSPLDIHNGDELLRKADGAMYRAKRAGKQRYEVAT